MAKDMTVVNKKLANLEKEIAQVAKENAKITTFQQEISNLELAQQKCVEKHTEVTERIEKESKNSLQLAHKIEENAKPSAKLKINGDLMTKQAVRLEQELMEQLDVLEHHINRIRKLEDFMEENTMRTTDVTLDPDGLNTKVHNINNILHNLLQSVASPGPDFIIAHENKKKKAIHLIRDYMEHLHNDDKPEHCCCAKILEADEAYYPPPPSYW